MAEPNFRKMDHAQLVEAYNEMVLTAEDLGISHFSTTSRFADTPTARRRCEIIHHEIKAKRKENGPEKNSTR